MTTTRGFSGWGATALLLVALTGCESTEFNQASGGTTTLVCDGGQSFVVTYQDGFEVAMVEFEGRTVELPKVRTSLGMAPSRGASRAPISADRFSSDFADRQDAGATGVRYSDGETVFLSRGRDAVLEIGGQTLSNCEVPRQQAAPPAAPTE